MSENREQMEETVERLLKDTIDLEAGSEEQLRAAEGAAKLYKIMVDEDRSELEHKDKIKEIEAKANQTEVEIIKHKKLSANTIAEIVVFGGLTIGVCIFEAKGHILPKGKFKFLDKIRIFRKA